MQRNINNLIGFGMKATDGEIGKVDEFYFDDQSWVIRYLVVNAGSWLLSRKVLISPAALTKFHWLDAEFPVNLNKDQIRNSPDIDTDKPVSRQQEVDLFGYYPWQPYWGSGFYAGGIMDRSGSELVIEKEVFTEADKDDKRRNDDIHLRSTHKITGYHIHAADGEIGHVIDFIIDDLSWKLIYFVVDTKNWIGGEKVLIPVEDILKISWVESEIYLNISIKSVTECRKFDLSAFTDSYNDPAISFERDTSG